MSRRTGGQLNPDTRRIEAGRMPKGSTEDHTTFRENQIARAAGDAAVAVVRGLFGRKP